MRTYQIKIKETIARVTAEEEYLPLAEAEIRHQRQLIESYIRQDPGFLHALELYPVAEDAPEIIRRMADASARVGVGPMAAVAGAISEFALRTMIEAGASHAIVDNGGDIAMVLSRPTVVGIFTGSARIHDIGLKFLPRPGIIGICTSSGTIGHSLSFGKADAATVIAADVCLADAAATALGNAAKEKDPAVLEEGLNSTWIEGIEGMLVIMDDLMAVKGKLPEIVKVAIDIQKISQ